MKGGRSARARGDPPGSSRPDPSRRSPGELTLVAFALLAVAAYALAQGTQTSQDGLVVVGVFAVATLLVGIVWPFVSLAGTTVTARAPHDATVGDVVPLEVTVEGRCRRLQLRLLDPPEAWHTTSAPSTGVVVHAVARRGVFPYVRIEVRTGGPIGAFLRRRTFLVALPVPVLVGPRPRPARWQPESLPEALATRAAPAPTPHAGDTVRAVRPYVSGDPARLVHWPSSARAGELVVRELEPPLRTGLALSVALGGDTEDTAEAAAGLGRAVLAAGGFLVVATREDDGPVLGPVGTAQDLGRRLARAVPGVPAPLPEGWPATRLGP